jgi:hypothetical protein
VRIEFARAMYHVIALADRRDRVQDDEDRRTFLRTLGEACVSGVSGKAKKSGWPESRWQSDVINCLQPPGQDPPLPC